ncbi:MAG: hypothetical protein IPQ22_16905 [Rhodoferax sp.]|nr:hypothetical protein [Rhodoferax sp.]
MPSALAARTAATSTRAPRFCFTRGRTPLWDSRTPIGDNHPFANAVERVIFPARDMFRTNANSL